MTLATTRIAKIALAAVFAMTLAACSTNKTDELSGNPSGAGGYGAGGKPPNRGGSSSSDGGITL